MVDPIELVAATCGVVKPKVTEATLKRAFDLPEKLAKRLHSWVLNPEITEFLLPEQHDSDKLFDILGTPATFPDLVADPFEANALDMKIAEMRAMLVKRYPVVSTPDFLDDSLLPASDDEKQDWLALVAVCDDSSRLVDEVAMGSLMPEQVEVYKESFPGLYQELFNAAEDAIVEVNARGEELTDDAESTLQILLQTGQADKPKVLDVKGVDAPRRKVDLSADGQETLRERVGSK
jgi:hypothetical protein